MPQDIYIDGVSAQRYAQQAQNQQVSGQVRVQQIRRNEDELPGWGTHPLNDPAIVALRKRSQAMERMAQQEIQQQTPPKIDVYKPSLIERIENKARSAWESTPFYELGRRVEENAQKSENPVIGVYGGLMNTYVNPVYSVVQTGRAVYNYLKSEDNRDMNEIVAQQTHTTKTNKQFLEEEERAKLPNLTGGQAGYIVGSVLGGYLLGKSTYNIFRTIKPKTVVREKPFLEGKLIEKAEYGPRGELISTEKTLIKITPGGKNAEGVLIGKASQSFDELGHATESTVNYEWYTPQRFVAFSQKNANVFAPPLSKTTIFETGKWEKLSFGGRTGVRIYDPALELMTRQSLGTHELPSLLSRTSFPLQASDSLSTIMTTGGATIGALELINENEEDQTGPTLIKPNVKENLVQSQTNKQDKTPIILSKQGKTELQKQASTQTLRHEFAPDYMLNEETTQETTPTQEQETDIAVVPDIAPISNTTPEETTIQDNSTIPIITYVPLLEEQPKQGQREKEELLIALPHPQTLLIRSMQKRGKQTYPQLLPKMPDETNVSLLPQQKPMKHIEIEQDSEVVGELDLFAQDLLDVLGIEEVKINKKKFRKHFASGGFWVKEDIDLIESPKIRVKRIELSSSKRGGKKWPSLL